MRSEVQATIDRYEITERVQITGWASGEVVRQHLDSASVMILPSFAEGLPVVIMEALAMGRPVISTYVAGIPELIRPAENGWLVPAGDVDAIESAMRDALNTPIASLREMGEHGRAMVRERHDIKIEVAKLLSHIKQLKDLSDD